MGKGTALGGAEIRFAFDGSSEFFESGYRSDELRDMIALHVMLPKDRPAGGQGYEHSQSPAGDRATATAAVHMQKRDTRQKRSHRPDQGGMYELPEQDPGDPTQSYRHERTER